MNKYTTGLPEEDILPSLRALYGSHGFSRYRMSKFEEYGLYSENRDFLCGEDIISFSDFGGRLMALRPDVTLSIAKNARMSDIPLSVYYCENVYRRAKGSRDVKEILQTGLEYIGRVDCTVISEVIYLAYKSLALLSGDFMLDISHMGIISAVFSQSNLPKEARKDMLSCIGQKNSHRAASICDECGITGESRDNLVRLCSFSGSPDKVLDELFDMCHSSDARCAAEELRSVCQCIVKRVKYDNIKIDFSVVNDMNYYDGIIFDGFVKEVPFRILSGGSYGKLMRSIGKDTDAIGFAVSLGEYGEYAPRSDGYDFDIFIAYNDRTPYENILKAIEQAEKQGKSFRIGYENECNARCREIVKL